MVFALALILWAPLGEQIALAEQDDQAPPAEEVEDPAPEPTPEPTPTAEVPLDVVEDPVLPTEVAPDIASTEPPAPETHRLTISVYRCDHPEFDPHFSENIQMVFDQCTGTGFGTFTAIGGPTELTQAGSALEFEIFENLAIIETLQPGYDNAIANCFLYDLNGALADQIGPGETSSGAWKVGGIRGDVHCDWYQVDRGIGNVYVVNMACPASALGFPAPTQSELAAICNLPAGQKQFFVEHGAGLTRMGVTGGEFNDVLLEAIQTGPIEIWLDDPGAFESARVFCQVNTLEGVEISPFAEVAVSDFRTSDLALGHGQRLHCGWFNLPEGPGLALPDEEPAPTQPPVLDDPGPPPTAPPAGNLSDLTIVKHICPPGYDPFAVGANPMLNCPDTINGVNFTLTDEDPDTVDLQTMTGDSIAGAVFFGGLVPGDFTVTETVPNDIDVVFVLGCGGGGGIDPIPTVIDGSLEIGIPQGILLTCHWFNVPEVGAQQGVARVASPEASPGVAAALVGTASLTMYSYTCLAGFDVAAVNANPQASCTLSDGVQIEMDDAIDDSGSWIFETGFTGSGHSTVADLAAGAYFLDLQVANGTTDTFVWDCYDVAGISSRTDPLAMDDTLTYDLADGVQIRCDWFQITGGTGRVIVNNRACGYLVPAYTLTYEQLGTQCTDDPGTIEYTVVSGPHQESKLASKSPLVLASFANVPSGYMAVVETLPDGWATPIVWCQVNDENANPVSPPVQMEVYGDRQVNVDLEPGQVVFCDWFNVAQGFVDVHISKHVCPMGFDAYAADATTLATECASNPGTVDFTVEDGALYLQTNPATGAAPAVFENVPSGQIRVSETLPDGYGLPVVFCRVDFEDNSIIVPFGQAPVEVGPSIAYSLSAGQSLHCNWVNVFGGLGSVSIWSQACPEGFDALTATRLELELGCSEEIGTVDFALANGSFSDTASSTNLFRYADFPAVPAGMVTLTETSASAYDTAVVYCRVQETGQPVTPAEKVEIGVDRSFSWDLEANQWLICQWYSAYDTGSTVMLIKFECPAGTLDDQDQSIYIQNCTQPHDGVDFTLTHSGGASTMPTVGGLVQWTGIPLGPFSIQELIPLDYGEPIVFCGVTASSGGPLDAVAARVEATGGYVESTFDFPNTTYLCYWYNILGGPGEITMHKFTCPPGYDLHASGAAPLVDCAEKTNGVNFTLIDTDPATVDLQSITGDSIDGAVYFGGLAPGDYTAIESVPPETAYVFVLDCVGLKMGAIRPYPLSMGDTLTIPVGAGESIVCYWMNVPEYEGGRLTVVKHQCSTMTYISDVDCEVYEDGQGFDLVFWIGEAWEYHSTGTTDGVGQFTWIDLTPGEFWVDEHDRDWCHMASEWISEDGNWLNVVDDDVTIVNVYNCSGDPGDKGKPGATPTKYPNTGTPPDKPDPGRETP